MHRSHRPSASNQREPARSGWSLVALVILSMLGCAPSLRLSTAPGETIAVRAQWIRLRSQHFTVVTDIEPEVAREVVHEFELLYDQLRTVLFRGADAPSMATNVVLFDRSSDLAHFARNDSVASFFRPQLLGELEPTPTLVVHGDLSRMARSHFVHELTHRFLEVALGQMPPWLNEGLACYYATLRPEREGRDWAIWLGDRELQRGFTERGRWRPVNHGSHWQTEVPIARLPSVSELLNFDRQHFYADSASSAAASYDQQLQETANYAAAWALVHMLLNGSPDYRDRFTQMLGQVARGAPVGRAFAHAFAGVDFDALERDLVGHVRNTVPSHWKLAYNPPEPSPIAVESMPIAEVWLQFGRLSTDVTMAAEYFGKAQIAAPRLAAVAHALASLAILEQDWHLAQRHLRHAVEWAPGNPGYLHALIGLYAREDTPWTSEQRDAATDVLVPRLADLAESARQLDTAAWYAARRGDFASAGEFSQRALRRDPGCWQCFDTYARILFSTSAFVDAANLQRAAIDRAPPWVDTGTRATMNQRLVLYESKLRRMAHRDAAVTDGGR